MDACSGMIHQNGPRSRTERLGEVRRQRFSYTGTQSRWQVRAERRNSSYNSEEPKDKT